MAKRNDIQGIRGLAIAAVLAFHLDDSSFPSGFIGVDMFFVLSGYLMSVILSKEPNLNMSVFRKFYTRRFKRIVPLYAILIAALTFIVPCLLMRTDVLKFCQDVIWASVFATNVHAVIEANDYFAELSDSNVLTHTWSLGVEIQYYLIVPIIILAQRKLSQSCKYLPFLSILLIASLLFQLCSSPDSAFNALPSRVWQFLAGGLAHEYSPIINDIRSGATVKYAKLKSDESLEKQVDEEEQSEIFNSALGYLSSDFLSLVLYALVLSPWSILPVPVLRFVAVLITSGLLFLGNEEGRQGFLLTNRPLVYLGDLSYIVYLVHWPVIIIWKSVTDSVALSIFGICSCLAISFALSMVMHHTIEQYFIRTKTKTATIAVAILYGIVAICLVLNMPLVINSQLERQASSSAIADAIKWNERASHNGWLKRRPYKECVDDPEGLRMSGGYVDRKELECVWISKNAKGTVKILVIGNSISHLAGIMLKTIIEQNFPQVALVRQFAGPACKPIDAERNCKPFLKAIPTLVRAMRPDITFIITNDSKRLRAPLKNATTDAAIKDFTAFLQPIVNASRIVILDEFYPQPTTKVAILMHKRLLSNNQSFVDLKGTYESFTKSHENYFARLNRIQFPNLIRHNTGAPLCAEEKGVCWWYNRKNLHSYFTDHIHLTTDGLELLRESYTTILRNAIQNLE